MVGDDNQSLGFPIEESKTASNGFPRMAAINSTATRRATDVTANDSNFASRLYPEDSHVMPASYGLQAALNGNPFDLQDINEQSALRRILDRDVSEPLFPSSDSSSNNRASRIAQEMRAERMRRANPQNRGRPLPQPRRELGGWVDDADLQEIEQLL